MTQHRSDDYMDDVLDHPYVGASQDEISLLESIEAEYPVRWVGRDKIVVERRIENPHWSELPKPVTSFAPREYGDNDKSSPEQNWDEEQ